jgi:hypothetical protein
MGIAISLVMIAAGAILEFAVTVNNSNGVNWNTVGVILMAVGALGLIASLIFWSSSGGRGGTTYVDRGPGR